MKHQTQIVPTYDASDDVSDWWMETFDQENELGQLVHAVYETGECADSFVTASGPNGYRHVGRDATYHMFIGLTVEDRDDIRFIDLTGFHALGAEHGFDAAEQIGKWQDAMDFNANE